MRSGASSCRGNSPSLQLCGHYVDCFFVAHRALQKFSERGRRSSKCDDCSVDPLLEAEAALEHFRMSVTNVPVKLADVEETRRALDRVFERVMGADEAAALAAEMNAVINRSSALAPLGESSSRNSSASSYLDKSCYVQTRMQRVVAGIFIGSYHPAADRGLLEASGITHVCCCIDVRPRFPEAFRYVTLPADDSPQYNIAQHFDATFHFIDGAVRHGGAVLIHCGAGISRAPTILAAYLIRKLRISPVSAVHMIRAVRSCASPNMGFMSQLQKFHAAVTSNHDMAAYAVSETELAESKKAKQPLLFLEDRAC
jgi:hypothetical protein